MRRPALVALLALAVLAAVGCSSGGSPPEVPTGSGGEADPVLLEGRDVFATRCQTCHGASGGGSVGPKLSDGRAVEQYPDVADQIEVVTEGRGSMPAFGEKLDPDEIEAVVRYTREVL